MTPTNTLRYQIKVNDQILATDLTEEQKQKLVHDFCEDELQDNRVKRIESHIQDGDYFNKIAAILNVILVDKNLDKEKVIKNLICDLFYLQDKYRIIKK